MIYFLYGEDSYRSKKKLEEIVEGYKKVHKSGLNLIYINAKEDDFKSFYSNFKIASMFAEKKLIILRNAFLNPKFQEEFSKNIESIAGLKDIVIIFSDQGAEEVDRRTKFFKELQKHAKCQEFIFLQPAMLKKWVLQEFLKNKVVIDNNAIELLISFVGSNLWQMANEINKLSNYKSGGVVKREDVELLIKPNIENDIFKTIEALASKNKKQALSLMHKHLDKGDNPLYLLSMVAYQFRNLLIVKEQLDNQRSYQVVAKSCGLHPFMVQKSSYLCAHFSMAELKKIYQNIFQIDLDIKTGKIEAETALDLLLSQI